MTGFATGLDASVSRSARPDVVYVLGSTGETDLVRSFVSRGAAQEAAQSAPGVLEVDGRRAASVELHSESRVGNEIVLVRGVTDAAWLVHPEVTLWAARNVKLELTATTAEKLYGTLRSALRPVASLAWLMAGLVLVGGLFACANTMFAAVLVRTREMGTLRAVGYGPAAIGA